MFVVIALTAAILAIILAIWAALYAAGILKRGFARTEAVSGKKPVSKTSLKRVLLKLGKKNPFTATAPKDTDVRFEWKIVDARWIEVLGKGWHNKAYTAWALLDDSTKTVKYNEQIVEKAGTAGAIGIHGQSSFFRGVTLWQKERSYRYGIREDFSIGEIYNYTFDPSQIKDVVRQIANDHGWAFELVTTRSQASYPM